VQIAHGATLAKLAEHSTPDETLPPPQAFQKYEIGGKRTERQNNIIIKVFNYF
jgi:hypothetical protein